MADAFSSPEAGADKPRRSRRDRTKTHHVTSEEADYSAIGLSKASRQATLLLFGCISLAGCRSAAVRRLAFYPPTPPGYSIEGELLFIQDPQQPNTSRDSQCLDTTPTNSPGRSGCSWGESVQDVLRRNNLPERVRVCVVPRQRRFPALRRLLNFSVLNAKGLAAVLLWSPCGSNGSVDGASQPPVPTEEEMRRESLRRKQLILFSHGNSTDIGYMFGVLYRLCYRCRVNVLCYDYSGYGLSAGKVSEKALYANVRDVWRFAVHELGVPPRNIILYGHSVGSAPSCDLAAKSKTFAIGGVILHAALASGLRLFVSDLENIPWFDAFINERKIAHVEGCPVFLIHGRNDTQVPLSHSLLLEAAARKRASSEERVRTWWVPNADHNDVEQKAGVRTP